jgi:hypothetical protein
MFTGFNNYEEMTDDDSADFDIIHLVGAEVDSIEDFRDMGRVTLPFPPRAGDIKVALIDAGLFADSDDIKVVKQLEDIYYAIANNKVYQLWRKF